MRKVLEFMSAPAAERVYDAIQDLGGYPHESPRVGRLCHQDSYLTLRWAPILLGSDGVYRVVFPGRLDGRSTTVRGQRVTLRRQDAVDRVPMDDDQDVTPRAARGIASVDLEARRVR